MDLEEKKMKEEMDLVLKDMMFRIQYRDILDDGKNWIKQLFY